MRFDAPRYDDEQEIIMQKKIADTTIESPNDRLAPLEEYLSKRQLKGLDSANEEAPIIDWTKAKVVTKIEPSQPKLIV